MASKWIMGKGILTTAGGNTLNITGFSIEHDADPVDVSHSGSGGVDEQIAGFERLMITISSNYDTQANYAAGPPNLKANQIVAVSLALASGAPVWSGSMMIKKTSCHAQLKNAVTFEVTGQSTGTYTLPVGTF